MSKRLDREFAPHSVHLRLHNGATGEDDDTDSMVKPAGRKRDNRTIAIRNEVQKRALESSVARGLEKDALDEETPRKKVSWAVLSQAI
ncbi:hypothetical protein K505DRAFT_367299 [Melanomma pulvis-pyrius CBS 109.77]|uniref:Uncharacterized protein n=1 Tax=Melanomma pulvis-pyrius CBS 109.77 TaxID=1314802 RepID=A0A6A6WUG4_9PLEO|nr:hypothetical protein K505DRAFT_367299 [Melanomma pulvis-pyrius CBS 109.77]